MISQKEVSKLLENKGRRFGGQVITIGIWDNFRTIRL